jgi:hypothetical protein
MKLFRWTLEAERTRNVVVGQRKERVRLQADLGESG